ncbi:uncharacterized protein HD556DRAFT_1537002 [Suillus plorans]|uniref:Uncharacterized protein n=1 Tax=Suillus plorans TaxID=116603 RepID=A0A9P7ANX9_9AGAM|nr:uncharacterized protein HD556DRAFT_1537002 [Suillus plorans]KAG1792138.1 hypothetical protein HD556DRAFT_1537002 [Suillus plorans]
MDENNHRKKRWGRPKPSHSDHHLVETTASPDPSSLSPSRNGSHERRSGSVFKLFGKVAKRFARSIRQPPTPEHTVASSSLQDTQPSTRDLTPPTLEPDCEQSSHSGIVEAKHLDPKCVNERIANANKGLAGASHVPTILQDTSSTTNNLPSVSDAIDTFSVLLKPLKAFNSIANAIADVQTIYLSTVHPYAKVALSIFTCASKVDKVSMTDDSRSGRPRCRCFSSALKDI